MTEPGERNAGECSSCGFETMLTFYLYQGSQVPEAWLCELCANTPAGNAYHFPSQYPDSQTLKAICYVGNVILAAMNKRLNARDLRRAFP